MRKHLGFSITEWRALPWWQERLYLEQLDAELVRQAQAHQSAFGTAAQGQGHPVRAADQSLDTAEHVSADDLGINVVRAKFG